MSGYCDKCGHTACICGEMKISDKIQMTEEQADQIYDAFLYKASNEISRQQFKNELKLNGFIIKSDLEILIEEAEYMFTEKYNKNTQTFCEVKQHNCIQAMKAELNKRRDK